jgi:hypothetical protein
MLEFDYSSVPPSEYKCRDSNSATALPSTLSTIHYSLIIPSNDVIQSEILAAS